MAYIKYTGSVINRSQSVFRIDIIDTENESISTATEVKIQELKLSRTEIKKTDSIASGSLDITLLSETNYQFLNLYTANQFQYKVKLYQDDLLIWSGHLDPEVYEEPYNYNSGYSVSITATDLGILKRNKLTITGIVSIFDIIKNAIEVSRLSFVNLYIPNTIEPNQFTPYPFFEHMYVQMTNFGDKAGFTILEEVLKSFRGLKMFYISGNIYISDFDTIILDRGFYNHYDSSFNRSSGLRAITHKLKDINILGTDAKLSMLPTYSNAKLEYKLNPLANVLSATHGSEWESESRRQSIPVPEKPWLNGFDCISYGSSGSKTLELTGHSKWVKLESYNSNADSSGARCEYYKSFPYQIALKNKIEPHISPNENCKLRIKLKVLLSVSNNPFEDASLKNEEGNNKRFKDHSNIIYFWGDLYLKNEEGEVIYYYVSGNGWVYASGSPPTAKYVFAYYTQNRKNDTPAGKFMTNGPFISQDNRYELSSIAESNIGKGDIIDLPPAPGRLQINVYEGFGCYDYKEVVNQRYSDFKWLIFNSIHVDIEDSATGNSLENSDIVYQCRINDYAQEEYNDTLSIGSNIDINPISQSSIFKKVQGEYQIETKFEASGKTRPLEGHLISSLFSNFASKQIKITTSCIPNIGFGFHVEKGVKMIKLKSNWDLIGDKEGIVLVEFHESDYNVYYE